MAMVLLALLHSYVASVPPCTNLTGWWNGAPGLKGTNAISQIGAAISVIAGDTTYKPGVVTNGQSGNTVTVYFNNVKPSAMAGKLSANCRTITWPSVGAVWHLACADPPGMPGPGPRSCSGGGGRVTCCAEGTVCASGGATPGQCVLPPTLKKIHVVYMTHLDLGFTDSTRNVCDKYADSYFPAAYVTAAELKKNCTDDATCPRFSWTEFPWIIQELLDGATGCMHKTRSVANVTALEAGIARGDIIWHANAVNFLTEVLDEPLWDYSLRMKDKLNARFNKSHGTLCGKLADTTGMSKSAIPTLAKRGVKAFHIGYNGVGGIPDVNATFRWRHENGSELLTMIEADYGKEIDLPVGDERRFRSSIVHAGDEETALVFLYTVDNTGPPTAEQVTSFWAALRKLHPKADIKSSSLDAFAAEVLAGDVSAIPVVTQELGDSWLYGAPADPIKVATFREARRFMQEQVKAKAINTSNPFYDRFMRRLMKGPCEHNWGYSVGNFLPELRKGAGTIGPDGKPFIPTWTNKRFHEVRDTAGYQLLETEWAEQREWMYPIPSWSSSYGWSRSAASSAALTGGRRPSQAESLEWSEFTERLNRRLIPLANVEQPATAAMARLSAEDAAAAAPKKCGKYEVGVDASNGAINFLLDSESKQQWSGPENLLGALSYMTFTNTNFAHYATEYAGGDFGKQGMETANVTGGSETPWLPKAVGHWRANWWQNNGRLGESGCSFVSQLALPAATVQLYGAPKTLFLNVSVPGTAGAMADVTLTWREKTATRIPEATWMSFHPKTSTTKSSSAVNWTFDVLGHPIDPLDVPKGGTRFKHAVWDGATLHDSGAKKEKSLRLRTLDSAILAPGDTAHLLKFCHGTISPGPANDTERCGDDVDPVRGGVHANVHNNLWGTAFPQWYDDDASFRFQLLQE